MPDVFTKAKRSQVMSRIRGHGNKDTELALIRLFRNLSITGWRRHRAVFGRPDFVFPRIRAAVFVDGCFWHRCPKHGSMPGSNAAFWRKKFATNKARDQQVTCKLRRSGWSVLRIWEHELAPKNSSRLTARIQRFLVVAEFSALSPHVAISLHRPGAEALFGKDHPEFTPRLRP